MEETIKNLEQNETVSENVSRLVDGILSNSCCGALIAPAVNIYEKSDGYIVRVALPGARKENIGVEVKDRVLTLSGVFGAGTPAEGEEEILAEIPDGKFTRSFKLGEQVKTSDIKAVFRDGILEIRLPKTEEVKPAKINIE